MNAALPTLVQTLNHRNPVTNNPSLRIYRTDFIRMPDGVMVAIDFWHWAHTGALHRVGEPRAMRDGESA